MKFVIFLAVAMVMMGAIDARGKPPRFCKKPADSGPCLGHFPMWYSDASSMECKEFVYGGCEGNRNRFETKDACIYTCSPEGTIPWICTRPADPGPCYAYMPMWFFDTSSMECKEFVYGGCKGNRNRFKTLYGCMVKCSPQDVTLECPAPWKGENGKCDKIADMCQTDSDCQEGTCCFNGCQNDCIKLVECPKKCDPNAECIDFEGSGPRCVCNFGFYGDGETCSAVTLECPAPWKGENGICDLRADMCQTDSDCPEGTCCFNGCQNDCLKLGKVECPKKCDPNAECIHFVGSGPRCVCNFGFYGDGETCSA